MHMVVLYLVPGLSCDVGMMLCLAILVERRLVADIDRRQPDMLQQHILHDQSSCSNKIEICYGSLPPHFHGQD